MIHMSWGWKVDRTGKDYRGWVTYDFWKVKNKKSERRWVSIYLSR